MEPYKFDPQIQLERAGIPDLDLFSATGPQTFSSQPAAPYGASPGFHALECPSQTRGCMPRSHGYLPSTEAFKGVPRSSPSQLYDTGRPVNIVLPNSGTETQSLFLILSSKVERLEHEMQELRRAVVQAQEESKVSLENILLPPLPAAPRRALRLHTSRTTSQRPAFHASRQLSPVPEIPYPPEIQAMQLEVDVLNQELATARRQAEEMEQQVASLKKEIQQYQRQISRQNHLVAQIVHTVKFFFSDYQVAADRFQPMKTALPEMKQVPRQNNGWI
ncbi:hypothetical protein N0V88_007358 [Collariella sp. IMI 366227]|nr:hypothetical protein N0V88_007358 [Collariella sp. IMI 366227]